MQPGRYDLTIVKGGTFRQRFVWKAPPEPGADPEPVDLSGAAARSQVRVNGVAVLTFDTDDDTITVGDDGSIELLADAETVSAAAAGAGAWSLEVEPAASDRVVLLMGKATILEEITR